MLCWILFQTHVGGKDVQGMQKSRKISSKLQKFGINTAYLTREDFHSQES